MKRLSRYLNDIRIVEDFKELRKYFVSIFQSVSIADDDDLGLGPCQGHVQASQVGQNVLVVGIITGDATVCWTSNKKSNDGDGFLATVAFA